MFFEQLLNAVQHFWNMNMIACPSWFVMVDLQLVLFCPCNAFPTYYWSSKHCKVQFWIKHAKHLIFFSSWYWLFWCILNQWISFYFSCLYRSFHVIKQLFSANNSMQFLVVWRDRIENTALASGIFVMLIALVFCFRVKAKASILYDCSCYCCWCISFRQENLGLLRLPLFLECTQPFRQSSSYVALFLVRLNNVLAKCFKRK